MSVQKDVKLISVPRRKQSESSADIVVKPSPEHIPDEYEHNDNRKAKVYIFYEGYDLDVDTLNNYLVPTLTEIEYEVTQDSIQLFKTKGDIDNKLDEITSEDHSETTCLILFFFGTIKTDDTFLIPDHSTIRTNSIWSRFTSEKCSQLKNIPKILFFQGRKFPLQVVTDTSKFKHQEYDIPAEADILLVFKVIHGATNDEFIKQFCEKVETYGARDDIISLITLTENQEHRPLIISTLTRKFYITTSDTRGYHLDHKNKTSQINEILITLQAHLTINTDTSTIDRKTNSMKRRLRSSFRKQKNKDTKPSEGDVNVPSKSHDNAKEGTKATKVTTNQKKTISGSTLKASFNFIKGMQSKNSGENKTN